MVTFATSDSDAPAAANTLVRLVRVCAVCPSIVVLVKLSCTPHQTSSAEQSRAEQTHHTYRHRVRSTVEWSVLHDQRCVGGCGVRLTEVSSPMEPLANTRLPDTTACE